jgi:predicted RNA-binding protein with PUA-like domain
MQGTVWITIWYTSGMKQYWLIKTEAGCYSIDDFKKDKKSAWTGIRNYQARNFMKEMKRGDLALFYHSSSDPTGVAGIAEVVKEAYPDYTALDKKDEHFDPKATKEKPIWEMVDFKFVEKLKNFVSLDQIKFNPKLKGIMVTQRGSRLSVMPVSETSFYYYSER